MGGFVYAKKFDIFEKCNIFCQNCCKNKQKTCIFQTKNGNDTNFANDEKQEKFDISSGGTPLQKFEKCPTATSIFERARQFEREAKNERERVGAFHAGVELIEKLCSGEVAAEARRQLENEWMRVLLSTFDAIPNIISIITSMIDNRAFCKTLDVGLNALNENTYFQVDRMLEMMERKSVLADVYDDMQEMLDKISPKSREMAKFRFFERKSAAVTAAELGLGMRTIQRRTERLLDELRILAKRFALDADNIMKRVGGSEFWMLQWFKL